MPRRDGNRVPDGEVVELPLGAQIALRLLGFAQPRQFEMKRLAVIPEQHMVRDERAAASDARLCMAQFVAIPPGPQCVRAQIVPCSFGESKRLSDHSTRRRTSAVARTQSLPFCAARASFPVFDLDITARRVAQAIGLETLQA